MCVIKLAGERDNRRDTVEFYAKKRRFFFEKTRVPYPPSRNIVPDKGPIRQRFCAGRLNLEARRLGNIKTKYL